MPVSTPSHVVYRGQVRRVYGVEPARHQRHRHFILRISEATLDKWRAKGWVNHGAWGLVGQNGLFAVFVRSDLCRPARIASIERTGKPGRPKIRKQRGRPPKK